MKSAKDRMVMMKSNSGCLADTWPITLAISTGSNCQVKGYRSDTQERPELADCELLQKSHKAGTKLMENLP